MNQLERHIQASDGSEYILRIPSRVDTDSSTLKLYNKYHAIHQDSMTEYTIYRFVRTTTNGMQCNEIEKQIGILGSLSHRNIQALYDVIIDKEDIYGIYEKECIPLSEVIDKNTQISENLCKQIFHNILSAVVYIHSQKVAHLNINPDAIFFNDLNLATLGSFFVAERVIQQKEFTKPTGMLNFMPPEVFMDKPYDPYKVDVWSLGILLLLCFTNTTPFEDAKTEGVISRIKTTNAFMEPYIPEGAKDVINKCLTRDPNLRPTAAEIFQMPWVSSYMLYPDLDLQLIENPLDPSILSYYLKKKNIQLEDIKSIVSSSAYESGLGVKIDYNDAARFIRITIKATKGVVVIKHVVEDGLASLQFVIENNATDSSLNDLLKRIFEGFRVENQQLL